jgi:hypothetical protein
LFNGRLHVELLWLIAALISTMRSIDGSDR